MKQLLRDMATSGLAAALAAALMAFLVDWVIGRKLRRRRLAQIARLDEADVELARHKRNVDAAMGRFRETFGVEELPAPRVLAFTPPPQQWKSADQVCSHGVAMDVHCCGCHSGFLFDPDSCVCMHLEGTDQVH